MYLTVIPLTQVHAEFVIVQTKRNSFISSKPNAMSYKVKTKLLRQFRAFFIIFCTIKRNLFFVRIIKAHVKSPTSLDMGFSFSSVSFSFSSFSFLPLYTSVYFMILDSFCQFLSLLINSSN